MFNYEPREYDPLPEGLYYARIDSVDPNKPNRFKSEPEDPDTAIEYTFVIIEDENGDKSFANRKMWRTLSPFSKKNIEYYNASTGKGIVIGKDPISFDEQEMVGKTIRLLVKHKISEATGKVGNTIEAITSPPKSYQGNDTLTPTQEAEINIDDIPFTG